MTTRSHVLEADCYTGPASALFDAFEKLDGWRIRLRRGEALTRGGRNVWDCLPPSIRHKAPLDWIEGELLVPGGTSTAVPTALKASGDGLAFRPFHIPGFEGDALLEAAALQALGFDPPAYFGRMTLARVRQRWQTWPVVEGVILRPVTGGEWLKLKREATADLTVVGIRPGKRGGSVVCRTADGAQVAIVIHEDEGDDVHVGRIVEVRHFGRTASGSLRSPRFLRWRDDLTVPRFGVPGQRGAFLCVAGGEAPPPVRESALGATRTCVSDFLESGEMRVD